MARPSKQSEAETFLKELLSKGMVSKSKITQAARAYVPPFSEKVLRNAKTALGVIAVKTGYGVDPWCWRDPSVAEPTLDDPERAEESTEVEPEEDDEPDTETWEERRDRLQAETAERLNSLLYCNDPHLLIPKVGVVELATMIDKVEKHLLGVPKTKDAWTIKTFTKKPVIGRRWVGTPDNGNWVWDVPTTQIESKMVMSDKPVDGVRVGAKMPEGMEGVEVERITVPDGYEPHSDAERAKWNAWLTVAKWHADRLEREMESAAISATSSTR